MLSRLWAEIQILEVDWLTRFVLALLVVGVIALILVTTAFKNEPPKCDAAISTATYPNGTETTVWFPKGCGH